MEMGGIEQQKGGLRKGEKGKQKQSGEKPGTHLRLLLSGGAGPHHVVQWTQWSLLMSIGDFGWGKKQKQEKNRMGGKNVAEMVAAFGFGGNKVIFVEGIKPLGWLGCFKAGEEIAQGEMGWCKNNRRSKACDSQIRQKGVTWRGGQTQWCGAQNSRTRAGVKRVGVNGGGVTSINNRQWGSKKGSRVRLGYAKTGGTVGIKSKPVRCMGSCYFQHMNHKSE